MRLTSGFSFEPRGEIVEYAVKMKELPHGWFLSELLEKNLVGEKEINRVISTLHRFYQAETPTPEIEQWGTPEKLKISTDENFTQVEPFIGKTISTAAFEAIRHYTNRFYELNENLFHERIQQHRILDCHGDLHLDHVHLTPEATTIFDCIEFNDRFRFIDIANDLAFLAMDFDFKGRSDLGNLFLRNAARELGDCRNAKGREFLQVLSRLRPREGRKHSSDRKRNEKSEGTRKTSGSAIFVSRLGMPSAGSEPLILVVMGGVGTGKSTIAKRLASELDWPVFSSDEIRKTLAGVPLTQRTPSELRAKIYSARMTQKTYRKLLKDGLAAIRGCKSWRHSGRHILHTRSS